MIKVSLLVLPYIFLLFFLLAFLRQLDDQIRLDMLSKRASEEPINSSPITATTGRQETGAVATLQAKQRRILCWVLTGAGNHMQRAIHVKRTWGSRCDKLLFMSTKQDEQLGTIALLGVQEGHQNLWHKTQEAFKYVWKHHRNDADWFLKADDDTYVFTDNLRLFLSDFDPRAAHYLGCEADFYHNNTRINAGGAGYVLSKEALRLFIEESLPYPEKCYPGIRPLYRGDEDTELGLCLQSVGVLPGNATDDRGRLTFSAMNPLRDMEAVLSNHSKWDEVQSWYADRPISFHYVQPAEFYVLEFLSQRLWHGKK